MTEQCSEIFEEVFNSHCGGCVRTCTCGKTYYDTYNDYDWDDGELEALEKDPRAVALDYGVGTMSIAGEEIVFGCDCDHARRYENFIISHASQLAAYLTKRAAALEEEAKSIKVDLPTPTVDTLNGEDLHDPQ